MEGLIVEMDMFHLRWLGWWMDFSENYSQAAKFWPYLFYLLLFYMLIFSVISPKHMINCSIVHLVASQSLQNNCMLVITLVTKSFNILKSHDKQCHMQGCLQCQMDLFDFLMSFRTLKHPQKVCITTSSWLKNNYKLCCCDESISEWSGPMLTGLYTKY